MLTISALEARKNLAELLNRVEYKGEHITIHRRGKPASVLIPIEDHELLHRLMRAEEDRIDAEDATAALAEGEADGSVPWEEVRAELDDRHGTRDPAHQKSGARRKKA